MINFQQNEKDIKAKTLIESGLSRSYWNMREAIDLFQGVLDDYPDSQYVPYAHLFIGYAYWEETLPCTEKAIFHLNEAHLYFGENLPDDDKFLSSSYLGFSHLLEGDYRLAFESLKSAIKLKPDDGKVLYGLHEVKHKLGIS